ncbi:dynein axonemal heavy chain 11-like [Pan paniscus]|uniref:dynein axonemal heavy chain 11-like n=1 Tax=Pan paniscus TaxID=9597 RepID=UPI00243692E9|nr:dynein axonemal heavy chain 11-like isoform X2 [Pan paniscus]
MTAAPAFFPPQVPWEDLRYLFDEIMYGGHITDDGDCKLCRVYLEEFMNPSLLPCEEGHVCFHFCHDCKFPKASPAMWN